MALRKGKNVLFNTYIYYTKIKSPALRYGLTAKNTPHGNREYSLDALVTSEDYKLLRKKYKNVKAIKGATELTAVEFEAKFKVAPPYEDENDEYIVIKFKKHADYIDGNASPKPIVKAAKGCTTPISVATEIGNGTEAHVQWREREWAYQGKKGLSLDLVAVGIINLVEHVSGVDLEFDFEEGDEMDEMDAPFDTEDSKSDTPNTGETSNKEEEASDDDW